MSNPKWEIGPVKLANGTEGHIDFVNECSKSIVYTGRFRAYNGDWWAIHWDESGRVPYTATGHAKNLIPPPKKTVRVKAWLNVDANGGWRFWHSEEHAHAWAHANRIACKEIDIEVTEGEGL